MSIVADVRFQHDRGALAPTFAALPDVDAIIVRETSTEPASDTYFVRFDADGGVREVLARDETVASATPVSVTQEAQVLRVGFADRTRLINPAVSRHGGVVLHARRSHAESMPHGWRERWFLPGHEALSAIWRHARDEGFDFEIIEYSRHEGRLSGHTAARRLTADQREALALAYERGFFAEPREVGLEELAAELDISPSAAGGRLRRGLKLLVEESLVGEPPRP